MDDKLDARIRRRADERMEGEGRADGPAELHRIEAEREQAEHDEAENTENAAVSRWAAPVRGSYVEKGNEAATAARACTAGRKAAEAAENAAVSRWAAPVRGTYVEKGNEAARTAGKAREAAAAAHGSAAEGQERPVTLPRSGGGGSD